MTETFVHRVQPGSEHVVTFPAHTGLIVGAIVPAVTLTTRAVMGLGAGTVLTLDVVPVLYTLLIPLHASSKPVST